MLLLAIGLGVTLAGVATVHWNNRAMKKRPQSATDLAVTVGAPLIAGGVMMTLISAVMVFTSE